jgi:hypothetical protein
LLSDAVTHPDRNFRKKVERKRAELSMLDNFCPKASDAA